MNIKILSENKEYNINGYRGELISDIIKKGNADIDMPCGGIGKCGKCKIRLISGKTVISDTERNLLTNDELNSGIRLACKSRIITDCIIEPVFKSSGFNIAEDYKREEKWQSDKEGISLAVDIGTTTICFQLFDMQTGDNIEKASMLNSQKKYGADIISRIDYANKGGLLELRSCIVNDLKTGIEKIINSKKGERPEKIIISGNTVMLYFLLGIECKRLGVYPFENKLKKITKAKCCEFFEENYCDEIIISPCISAFVGGDIVSGALFCGIHKKENTILIDIGTNGETILNFHGRLYSTSAAAGPAFEGGNISCGTGSIDGAVNSVTYKNGKFNYTTINNKKPIGICGTGIIDAVRCFLENGFIDKNGVIKEDYFESGIEICENVIITQNDIRNIQLAKAAIGAAIECLIKESGAEYEEIENVFIGGGFGYYINLESCFSTGLIADKFRGKIKIAGNCSLGGACMLFADKNINIAEKICADTKDVILGKNKNFEDEFVKRLNF